MDCTIRGLETGLADLEHATLFFRPDFASFIKKHAIHKRRIDSAHYKEGIQLIKSINSPESPAMHYYVLGYIEYGYISDLAPHFQALTAKQDLKESAGNIDIGSLCEYVQSSFETNKTLAENVLSFRVIKDGYLKVDTRIFIRLNGLSPESYSDTAHWAEVSRHTELNGNNFALINAIYDAGANTKLDKFVREIDDALPALTSRDIVHATLFASLAEKKLKKLQKRQE